MRRFSWVAAAAVLALVPGAAAAHHVDDPFVQRLTFTNPDGLPAQVGELDISGDGQRIVFVAGRSFDAADEDFTDVYLLDVPTGEVTWVSRAMDGGSADGNSSRPRISADGSTVAFMSAATNLVPGDTNDTTDVFVHDLDTGVTSVASRSPSGAPTDGFSQNPSLSADGRYVAFASAGTNLTPQTTGVYYQGYVYDRQNDEVAMVSVNTDGEAGNHDTLVVDITPDGSMVAFGSRADDLVVGVNDVPTSGDIFVRDLDAGVTTHLTFESPGVALGGGLSPSISADGSTVVFVSSVDTATGDTNEDADAYLIDVASTELTWISDIDPDGPDRRASSAEISADGSTVVITYLDSPPALGGVGTFHVFRYNVASGVHTLLSSLSDGTHADGSSFGGVVDDDGDAIAFRSTSETLGEPADGNDGDNTYDLMLWAALDRFTDDDGTTFESEIEWLSWVGITNGCEPRQFCPDENVTRGQMAAFLNRALDLPAASADYFTDDAGSTFEDDINRLAEAEITLGCEPGLFCPNDPISRGQMAAFLNRALDLPVASADYFTDDAGSTFEDDINRLAEAEITLGCEPGLFCPDGFVTRGQMAAFLHRALG